jgi:hypothetical protein
MTEEYLHQLAGEPATNPSEEELAELRTLNERFSKHHIFWDFAAKFRIRFLAYATSDEVRPHTIISQDLAEVRDGLEQATMQELILPGERPIVRVGDRGGS